jgi:uncharacterized damage-inducible protein DinB
MTDPQSWREQIAVALSWGEAHVTLDAAIDALDPALRGQRPNAEPHSIWELVEHLRIAQHDLLDFCRNPDYVHITWPDDYWPPSAAPPSDDAWNACLTKLRGDRDALAALARDPSIDLTATIPHGSGQTYLRELILAIDHSAYHLGQIVAVRQALGDWPPKSSV